MARTSSLVAGAVLVALACGATLPAAVAATIGAPQRIGTISSSTLDEVSGLVDSRASADTFWVHNDSGDSARFYAMSHSGALLGTFPLAGVTARDWEDIAIGPKSGGGNYLYLGDIGDNDAVRSTVTVHRVVEPLSTTGATISTGSFASLKLRYPNGARDVESMFVDPLSGEMFFISKRLPVPEVYSVPTSAFDDTSETVTMTALGSFSKIPFAATAADISPDGRFIVVRSSSKAVSPSLFERLPGQSVAEALQVDGVSFTLGSESQGEAIGWAADGKSFFTTTELDGASTAPIHSYMFTAPLPEPLLAGDYNSDLRVDAADYTVWRNQFGSATALPNESATLGSVTVEDYDVWRAHFGASVDVGGAAMVVPEPAGSLLIVFGALATAGLRGRRG